MKKVHAFARLALCAAMLTGFAPAEEAKAAVQLASGIQGFWWNPQRSGEGFNVFILRSGASNVIGVAWYTMLDGKPVYLVGAAPHNPEATSVTFDVSQSAGTDLRQFVPANVSTTKWGTVTLTFDSCTAGTVTYVGLNGEQGTIALSRFGEPVGYSCTTTAPGQTYTFPYSKGDWRVSKSKDAITDIGSCSLVARGGGNSIYDVVTGFYKKRNTVIESDIYIAASASGNVYFGNGSTSVYRVDSNAPISLFTANVKRTTLVPQTMDTHPDNFGGLLPQLMSGTTLVVRGVPYSGIPATPYDATFSLSGFPDARAAFDYCVTEINAGR